MAPSLVTSYLVQSPTGGDTSQLVTPSFTPSAGELLVVKAQTWDTGTASGTPSGGSLTYTSRITAALGGFATYGRIWTAPVPSSPGSMQVTLSAPAASCYHSLCVERWTGATVAASPATASAKHAVASAPSHTITTVGTDSVISWLNGDAQSVSPTGRTYVSPAVESGIADGSSGIASVHYYAHQVAATPGSKTFGMSTPNTQKWVLAAVEILAAASSAAPPPRPAVRRYQHLLVR